MEHSCEAYWTKAEGLARDAICTMGLGAKRLTDAAKRQLEIADLRAGVNVGLRELGELLYATHTGTPTDSELLLLPEDAPAHNTRGKASAARLPYHYMAR